VTFEHICPCCRLRHVLLQCVQDVCTLFLVLHCYVSETFVVAVCCSVLQCIAVCCSVLQCVAMRQKRVLLLCVRDVCCCSMLQCVVVCQRRVLLCVVVGQRRLPARALLLIKPVACTTATTTANTHPAKATQLGATNLEIPPVAAPFPPRCRRNRRCNS